MNSSCRNNDKNNNANNDNNLTVVIIIMIIMYKFDIVNLNHKKTRILITL